jgi:hypothetical protein
MSANKKPKKKYRPKGVVLNPIEYVISGMKPPAEDVKTKLKVAYHWAMANLTKGRGTPTDWQEVTNTLNVAMVLCERGFGREYLPSLSEAADALVRMRDRYKQEGKSLLFRADEMKAVNEAIDLHDAQLDATLVKDVELAVIEVERRLRLKLFHKVTA